MNVAIIEAAVVLVGGGIVYVIWKNFSQSTKTDVETSVKGEIAAVKTAVKTEVNKVTGKKPTA